MLWHAATAVLDWTRVLRLELYEHENCPSTPLASLRSDAGGCRCVLGIAGATVLRPELALARSCRAFADSHRRFRSPRSSQCDSDSYIRRQYHHHRRHDCFLNSVVTDIPQHLETPRALLRSASALWIANILVFALWYWKLDAGGPLRRERPLGLMNSSFLFPQMLRREEQDQSWTPHFVDYLFLAFNTSTAFSPTDTAVLSRWAKLGMMVQSLVSLTIIALLAARAVNIL